MEGAAGRLQRLESVCDGRRADLAARAAQRLSSAGLAIVVVGDRGARRAVPDSVFLMDRRQSSLVVLCVCLALSGCSSQNRVARTSARPPSTRLAPVTESIQGASVTDNYRWLEGDDGKVTAEVNTWTDAQNASTRAVLDRLPGRQVLEDRFASLMRMGSVTPPVMRGNRYFYSIATADSQPIVYWREGATGSDRVLIDPARLDPA